MTYELPKPAYRQGYYCNKCGYLGASGPAHELTIGSGQGTAVSYPCPYLATGGGIFYAAEQMQAAHQAGREAMREEVLALWVVADFSDDTLSNEIRSIK